MRSPLIAHRQSIRSRATRGQELVEFTLLVTFFLIIFFCCLQVCITAIDKFHLNHYALYSARVWEVCPCSSSGDIAQINESVARVKIGEFAKKTLMGRKVTQGDMWRIAYLWGTTPSSVGAIWGSVLKPKWVSIDPDVGDTGVVFFQPLPIMLPYAPLVMGGTFSFPIPGLGSVLSESICIPFFGCQSLGSLLGINPNINISLPEIPDPTTGTPTRYAFGYTYIPMSREPAEVPGTPGDCDDDCGDNDGYPNDQLSWTDLADTGGLS